QPVTIKYITEPGRVDSGVKDAVNAYNALGRKITVELEGVPGNFGEKVLTLGAAGSLPELTHSHPRDYHPWRTGGLLVPLDDRLKIEKDAADLVPAALDYWLMDGQRWAVPYNLSVQNMYFNREIFEKAGQKTPDEYEKEGKWTWETYLDLARKLTSGSGDTKVFGCVWMATFLDIQLGVIWPFGGDLWDKERKKTVLDSKAALDAIQFQADTGGNGTAAERLTSTPRPGLDIPQGHGTDAQGAWRTDRPRAVSRGSPVQGQQADRRRLELRDVSLWQGDREADA
ncbi:MAG: extracellular solute-binding protein, partial [Chloroflexi bacterium]|nr:extracellular solute-binding protein [Chloroflexota bacterium]